MTQIKSSAAEGSRTVDVIMRMDGLTNLSINSEFYAVGIQVPTADLLEALGAAPKSDLDVWKAGAEAAEAAVERVRELIAYLRERNNSIVPTMIEKALDAPKPFELPVDKDYGSSFWAKNRTGTWIEFVVCKDYSSPGDVPRTVYATRSHAIYTADGIMHWFRDHTNEKPAEVAA
jgi:hypothetical protein